MRAPALLSLFVAPAALSLISIILFGGYNSGTLTNVDMFRFNISQIANTQFNNGTGNGCNCVEIVNGTLTFNGTTAVDVTTAVNGTLALNGTTELNGPVVVGYAQLDLFELYSVYALNYCEGKYLPLYQAEDAAAAILRCEKPSLSRQFDLVTMIERAAQRAAEALGTQISVNDLDWPDGMTRAFDFAQSAGATFVGFAIAGLGLLILVILAALYYLYKPTRKAAIFLFTASVLALMALAVCSGIATAILTAVVDGVNENGGDIGVSAKRGVYFLAFTWSAVALLLISTLITTSTLCMGSVRRMPQRAMSDKAYDMRPMPYIPRKPVPSVYMQYPESRYWADGYSSRRTLVDDRGDGYYYNDDDDDFR